MRGLAGGEMIKHIMFRENTEEQKKKKGNSTSCHMITSRLDIT